MCRSILIWCNPFFLNYYLHFLCYCLCLYFQEFPLSFLVVVSSLKLRVLISFELIFVQGERYRSKSSLLNVDIQFFQHNLLKRLSFLDCMFSAPLSKIKWLEMEWVYFWIFYSIGLLVCFCVSTVLLLLMWLDNIIWS
jgi:hypothetical protein